MLVLLQTRKYDYVINGSLFLIFLYLNQNGPACGSLNIQGVPDWPTMLERFQNSEYGKKLKEIVETHVKVCAYWVVFVNNVVIFFYSRVQIISKINYTCGH